MANASAKKIAVANTAALNKLHALSAAIFVSVVALLAFRGRPVTKTIGLWLPAASFEYFLDQSCRPVYQGEKLVKCGQDYEQKGLTEYMRDVIYITWVCSILSVIIGRKAWYLYWVIPLFVLVKLFVIFNTGKRILTGSRPAGAPEPANGSRAAAGGAQDKNLSKRQEKIQKLYAKRQPHQYAQAQKQYEQQKAKAQAQAQGQ